MLAVLLTLLANPAFATSISIPYTFVAGTTIVASQVNANFSVIAGVVNGNIDNSNIAVGANIDVSKLNLTESFLNLQSASNALGFGVGQTGDTIPRVGLYSDGSIQFGPGTATATDVAFRRTATNTVELDNGTLNTGPAYLNLKYGTLLNPTIGIVPGGRLYLGTGLPYTDHAATGTVYYGPAVNNNILLYNSTLSAYQTQTFAEESASLAALTANSVYDVYETTSSLTAGTLSFTAWGGLNTPPTRGTDAYGRLTQNGTLGALLVGVIYVNGTPQTIDNTSSRWVSNLYNAIPRAMFANDSSSEAATSSIAPVGANTTDGTGRVSFVSCLANQWVDFDYSQAVQISGTETASFGLGLNSTTAYNSQNNFSGTSFTFPGSVSYTASTTAGYNYMQKLCQYVLTGATLVGSTSNALCGVINN